MAEERVQRRLAAILAADVVGYSRLMGVDEESTLRTLKSFCEIIDRIPSGESSCRSRSASKDSRLSSSRQSLMPPVISEIPDRILSRSAGGGRSAVVPYPDGLGSPFQKPIQTR